MNWSHALLMAELLLKAADKIDTILPIAATKENTTMGDQTPIDASTAAPATIENNPATMPTTTVANAAEASDAGQSAVVEDTSTMAQSSVPTSASASTQTIISNAVEQPAISTPQTVADVVQSSAADKPSDLHQSISDLVRLAQILDGNPALFEFLKTLMPNAPSSST